MKESTRKRGVDPMPLVEPTRDVKDEAAPRGCVGASRISAGTLPLAGADQADRLLAALSRDLPTLYRLVRLVGDEDTLEDEIIEWVGSLARHAPEVVPVGRERAWLLRSALRLLGALVPEGPSATTELPTLPLGLRGDLFVPTRASHRLQDVLQTLGKRQRASLVLVVQEGLSHEQGASIQGGTRGAFVRRYIEAMASLDDELIEVMMGRPPE